MTTDVDSASQHAVNLDAITVPSYLDGAAIISAARESGCGAIHPGYGFLSENASFAKDVVEADLIWIGPNADVINSMGSKINARAIAESAGVPLIPGYSDSQAEDDLRGAADNIGYPILIKASAGGGGRGIRIVESPDQFATALDEARTEAERAFGDGSVIVERYVQQPRHVEVQLIGDRHGRVEHLGTRECSVQRRYQKLFEEAPAPNLSDTTRNGLHEAAVRLGTTVGYDSAGTVEFVVDGTTGEFFFLEMNTRLQVEHPVTEAITGLDLVGQAALPMGVLCLGAGLQWNALRSGLGLALVAVVIQLMIKPFLFIGLAIWLDLESEWLLVGLLLMCVSTAPSSFILARQLGGDAPLMAGIVAIQTVLAIVSVPIVLWIAETMNWMNL